MLQRKTQEELEVMHYANQVASAAHVQVQSLVLRVDDDRHVATGSCL